VVGENVTDSGFGFSLLFLFGFFLLHFGVSPLGDTGLSFFLDIFWFILRDKVSVIWFLCPS